MTNRLYRSRDNRMLFGVCGGLAEYLQIDPTLVRLAFIVLTPVSGIGVLAYVVLTIIVPLSDSPAKSPSEVMRENTQEIASTASKIGEDLRTTFGGREGETAIITGRLGLEAWPESRQRTQERRQLAGLILMALGALALLSNLRLLWWLDWSVLWPATLILIGALILLGRRS